jgi:hypothetical protein
MNKTAPNGQAYGEDFEYYDEFLWFLNVVPDHGGFMYRSQKQKNQRIIDECRARGMNDDDLQELLKIQCRNKINENQQDRDFWARKLIKSNCYTKERHEAINHHFYVLKDAIMQAFKEVMPIPFPDRGSFLPLGKI